MAITNKDTVIQLLYCQDALFTGDERPELLFDL